MLRLQAAGAESLWEALLPEEVKLLPADLAALDELLCDRALLAPIVARWEVEARGMARSSVNHGRPTIAMDTFVRLVVLKHRYGWGYRTLMAEVSDSLHLRRFARIALGERVPDESTVRKMTRRLGPEVVNELSRALITKARREKRFRPRAVRIDSTVIEADIKYPTDAGLASHGVRALARAGRRLAVRIAVKRTAVRDRSRAMGRRLRAISRTIRRRSGEAKQEVLDLTAQTGGLLAKSVNEARRLARVARASARGRGANAKLAAAEKLEELADRCERVVGQIKQRVAGEKITDRLVSLVDPDARPIRKGKLGKPNEFGYVVQLAEVTANTKSGARGFIVPAAPQSAIPARTRSCRRPSPNSTGSSSHRGRSLWTAGFRPPRPTRRSDRSRPIGCSSPGAASPDPNAHSAGWGATAPAPRDASRTSNAATDCAAAASRATKDSASGPVGAPWPTTSTPTPASTEPPGAPASRHPPQGGHPQAQATDQSSRQRPTPPPRPPTGRSAVYPRQVVRVSKDQRWRSGGNAFRQPSVRHCHAPPPSSSTESEGRPCAASRRHRRSAVTLSAPDPGGGRWCGRAGRAAVAHVRRSFEGIPNYLST